MLLQFSFESLIVGTPFAPTFKGNGLRAEEPRFLANVVDERLHGPIPCVRIGLNGLPNLEGMGRIRPPFDGSFPVSITGVLVQEPFRLLVARSKADEPGDWLLCESRHIRGGGHNGLRSWPSLCEVLHASAIKIFYRLNIGGL